MSDQAQRTEWALELFRGFVKAWTPPSVLNMIMDERGVEGWIDSRPGEQVIAAIRAIAPEPDDSRRVGYAVFRKDFDTEYQRERPSGFIYTIVGDVFENLAQAQNVLEYCKTEREGEHVICEIQQIPRQP